MSILEFFDYEEPYNAVYNSRSWSDHSLENEQTDGQAPSCITCQFFFFFPFYFSFCFPLILEHRCGVKKKNDHVLKVSSAFKILSRFIGALYVSFVLNF